MSENEKPEDKKETPETATSEETDKAPPTKKKYIFNCTKCGQCCVKREFIPVSLTDIKNWTKSGMINSVFPHLKIKTFQTTPIDQQQPQEFLTFVIAGSENGCPLFDHENRLCNVYHSLPLECKAFPLGYNGKNYFIKDKTVPGIGNGTMTKEQLIEDRDAARADFDARVETQMLLPLVYSLFMQNLMEQQKKVMDEMPEEKRKQLDDLLKSTNEKTNQ